MSTPKDSTPLRLPADYLIVVHSAAETSAAITAQIRDGVRPLGDGPMAKALKADGRWALIGESMTLAFVATDIDVFERIQPTPTTSRADATDPPR